MMDRFSLDQETIDPDSIERFKQYGSPDPENIDRQLLKEHRKNNRIKSVGMKANLADIFLAIVLDLVVIPLAYVSVIAAINLGWWGLVVPAIFSPAFASAVVYTARVFQG